MIINKPISLLLLLLIIATNGTGILLGWHDVKYWNLVDSFTIIALSAFGVAFLRSQQTHGLTWSILMFAGVLGTFIGHILDDSKYWIFIDVFIIVAAALISLIIIKTDEG
ncbi:MAG: hypothetical protein HAW58_04160 [Candidatus Thioglobus sp.]|nr:hypothetical protein [Candidatus Thioglobus sp.]